MFLVRTSREAHAPRLKGQRLLWVSLYDASHTTLHGAAPAGPRCHTLLTSVCFYGARETNRETRELFSIELVCTVHKHNTPMAAVPPRGRVAVASVLGARTRLSLYDSV